MSNCKGCFEAFGEDPNPHSLACQICIRNPKYPSMKMPEKAIIEEIELEIPQDMYIAIDRKKFEEKCFMKRLSEILSSLIRKEKEEKRTPYQPWIPYTPDPYKPWEAYWDYVYKCL